jgi:hypothetical protein
MAPSRERKTNAERRTERVDLRCTPSEVAALDFLALKWDTSSSAVVRSMIVGAALAQLDRLDDAIEPSFDALVDVPSIDDVLAGL